MDSVGCCCCTLLVANRKRFHHWSGQERCQFHDSNTSSVGETMRTRQLWLRVGLRRGKSAPTFGLWVPQPGKWLLIIHAWLEQRLILIYFLCTAWKRGVDREVGGTREKTKEIYYHKWLNFLCAVSRQCPFWSRFTDTVTAQSSLDFRAQKGLHMDFWVIVRIMREGFQFNCFTCITHSLVIAKRFIICQLLQSAKAWGRPQWEVRLVVRSYKQPMDSTDASTLEMGLKLRTFRGGRFPAISDESAIL